ncbi:hypothetical protein GCM10017044_11650 [Kordiimonas sediminis]|uniref:procollagen-lysine 5-dioxygenase n=1 Tax=Kordiimonas sediminis TaxID=1735581 RepID=A0A919APK6_9PROT|nr:GlcNAc-transferase family protein [Kordiimonas sediminis]GHF18780.1 hypothetical protein GCM10017044_11650 [Kordiimonas sediminis]
MTKVAPVQPAYKNSHVINVDPMIAYIDDVLSPEECDYIINLAKDKVERARVSLEGDDAISDGRTGSNTWIPHKTDDTIKAIADRIAGIVQIPLENAEALQVIHYGVSQEYKAHFDSYDLSTERGRHYCKRGGQRLVTALVYLNDIEEGGATGFPTLKAEVTAKKGRLALFHNCKSGTTKIHPDSLHAGTPVIKGEKWAFNLWFHARPMAEIQDFSEELIKTTGKGKAVIREKGSAKAQKKTPTSDKTIFIQIAAYRDPECQHSIHDLFDKAAFPDRLRVTVMFHADPHEDDDLFEIVTKPEQVTIHRIDAAHAQGVCEARWRGQLDYKDEDYVLQTDSHMRFEPGWDESLIAMLAECDSDKPVLTTYTPPYIPPMDLKKTHISGIQAERFDEFDTLLLRSKSIPIDQAPAKPFRGAFMGGCLLFGKSEVFTEVPCDPYLYFFGEEISLSARYWTHGFDIFHPNKLVAYQCWQRSHRKATHFDDHSDWTDRDKRSRQRVKYLLTGELPSNPAYLQDIEKFSLGTARSLEDYETFCGLDFRSKTLSERARNGRYDLLPVPATNPAMGPLVLVNRATAHFHKVSKAIWEQNPSSFLRTCFTYWDTYGGSQPDLSSVPSEYRRLGLIERAVLNALSNKKSLAKLVADKGLERLAPRTYFTKEDALAHKGAPAALWFIKKAAGTGGKGMRCVTNSALHNAIINSDEIIQAAVNDLMLLDGRKFTTRLYVLLWDHKIYLFKGGFNVIHGVPYQADSTDYAVQIDHRGYDKDDSPVTMQSFTDYEQYDRFFPACVQLIRDLNPALHDACNASTKDTYALLGIDILLQQNGCVQLTEINSFPNFRHTAEINADVNLPMLEAALKIMLGQSVNSMIPITSLDQD